MGQGHEERQEIMKARVETTMTSKLKQAWDRIRVDYTDIPKGWYEIYGAKQ
jgi:hypothetical protein